MLCSPARAVPGHDETEFHRRQRFDGGSDDGLEGRAAEMQASQEGGDVADSGEALRVPRDVDGSGVAATGEDHQPATAHVDHQCLVVDDIGIVVATPCRSQASWAAGMPSLVLGGSVDLAGDQDTVVNQERWLTPLYEREAFGFQSPPAQRRHLQRLGAGDGQSAAGPGHRVHHHGQRPATPGPCRQPRESSDVVEVTVTQDHSLDVEQVQSETVCVDHHRVGRKAGVEQQRRGRGAPSHGHQRGETVLGPKTHRRLALLELGCIGEAHTERRAGGPFITGQECVVHVVDQGRDHHLIDRFQPDRVDRIPRSWTGRNQRRIQPATGGRLTHPRTSSSFDALRATCASELCSATTLTHHSRARHRTDSGVFTPPVGRGSPTGMTRGVHRTLRVRHAGRVVVLVPRQLRITGMTGNVPYYGGRLTPAQAFAASHPSPPPGQPLSAPPPDGARAETPRSDGSARPPARDGSGRRAGVRAAPCPHCAMSGPVQVLVVEFDEPSFSGEVIDELTRLREAGTVRLVDVLLVHRDQDGTFDTLPAPPGADPALGQVATDILGGTDGSTLDGSSVEGSSVDGAAWSLADVVSPGSVAAVALIEHLWAARLVDAIGSTGGRLLGELWLSPEDRARLPG